MCIICRKEYDVNAEIIDCSYCSLLTEIPETLVNLKELYCHNCLNLEIIPGNLINLEYLT